MTPVARVRAPNPAEEALGRAAAELSPEKSLERVETTAKFVFANVAVVATVLSAGGFVTDVGGALDRGPKVLGVPLPVMLLAGSLVLATFALTPTLSRVRRSSPTEVAGYYERQIRRRGWLAILAMLALAGAIIAAVDVVGDEGAPGRAVSVSATKLRQSAETTVSAEATVGRLKAGETLRLRATGRSRRGRRLLLCRVASGPDAKGSAAVACPAVRAPAAATDRVVVLAIAKRAQPEKGDRRRLTLGR